MLVSLFHQITQIKSETMTYATEFFAVQKALGIENASNIKSTPFAALDSEFVGAGRLKDITKPHPVSGIEMRGIFVDNVAIVVQAAGKTVNIPQEKAASFFGI